MLHRSGCVIASGSAIRLRLTPRLQVKVFLSIRILATYANAGEGKEPQHACKYV